MSTETHSNTAFYCPVHQIRFHTTAGEVIECDQSPHALGGGFPGQSPWTYCCDCATFSPYEPLNGNGRLRECLVCERQITKRYLCSNCQVMSVESNALVRRKTYSIDKTVVQPNCPGCGSTANGTSREHKCDEVATTFSTSRATCLFCDLQIGPPAQVQVPEVPTPIEVEVEDDTLDELDEVQFDDADTDELVFPTPPASSWNFTVPHDPPKRKTGWIVGVVVALLSVVILVIVVSTGRRAGAPATEHPHQPSQPTYPGMVYVPGGEFTMGSDTGDEFERPAHKVRLPSFYIDINEVTCEDYLKFAIHEHHRLPPNWTNGSFPPGSAKQPVTGVDWYDASAYAKWAGKRLPTEAEWEYAARGGTTTSRWWGDDIGTGNANCNGCGSPWDYRVLADVDAFKPNPFGVAGMLGNAWEWTEDCWHPSYVGAPSDGSAWMNGDCSKHTIRGGSWDNVPIFIRSATRSGAGPNGGEFDYSSLSGFRLARELK